LDEAAHHQVRATMIIASTTHQIQPIVIHLPGIRIGIIISLQRGLSMKMGPMKKKAHKGP
jgi:hypothetical protein